VSNRIAALCALFAMGVALLQTCSRLPPMPGALLCVTACIGAATLWLDARLHGDRPRPWPIRSMAAVAAMLAAGLVGFSYAAWRADSRLRDELPAQWEERDVRVSGIVDDLPQQFQVGTRFAFSVLRVETRDAKIPERISLGWFEPSDDHIDSRARPVVHAGECWTLSVRLKRPHGHVNPHGFDLEAWLFEHDLRATGYVRQSADNARTCTFAGRLDDYVQRARERIRERIARALPDARYAGVLVALTIGDQRAIPEAQWSVFNRTGVTHLISISGLHVTVFATFAGACAFAIFRRSTRVTSRVPARKLAVLVGATFAFAYVLLAGAEVPAVRTLLMLVVAGIGLWLARPGTALLVWLWALAVVVVWDPWASLAPGFWLSFGAVGLLLYSGTGRLNVPRSGTWRDRFLRSLRAGAHAQWVVTIGLVPGTIALFQMVSLVSAMANAIAIPVVTLGIVPLALMPIVVPVDLPWQIAHFILAQLMRYLEWVASMPSATWASHAPLPWTVLAAAAGIAWLLAPRGVPGRSIGALLLFPLALVAPPAVPMGAVRVTVLDVGQGLAVFVATAQHRLLYDTGPRINEATDSGARIVLPFLRAIGVPRLDMLIVSHADSDHAGGVTSVVGGVPVGEMLSSLPAGHPLMVQAARRTRALPCTADTRWTWDAVTFTILHPRVSDYIDGVRKSNDLSCVVKIEAKGGSVLLTGDIEAITESALLARSQASLRADVLLVPHHGSRTSSTSEFIAAVAPSTALVAAGYRNRFGHPRADVVGRYRRAGASRWRTDLDGAITVTVMPDRPIAVYGERDHHRRYWYDLPAVQTMRSG
jgi:competence protein ComEC